MDNEQQNASNPLPSAIAMWKRAWGVFRKRMGVFIGIAVVQAVGNGASQALLVAYPKNSTLFVATSIALIVIQMFSGLALIFAAHDERVDVRKAFVLAAGKFWRLLWLGTISSIIVFGLSCFLLIPGLIVGIFFSFGAYILALEDKGGMNALFISREYVRGKWWAVLGYTLFPVLIVVIPVGIVSGALNALKVPYYEPVMSLLVGLFLTPAIAVYGYSLYAGFKQAKGAVSPKVTAGRKARYIVPALAGFILLLVLVGGSIAAVMYAASRADKGMVASPDVKVLPGNQSAADLDKMMKDLNDAQKRLEQMNVNIPKP
jgi:hypothetical protein